MFSLQFSFQNLPVATLSWFPACLHSVHTQPTFPDIPDPLILLKTNSWSQPASMLLMRRPWTGCLPPTFQRYFEWSSSSKQWEVGKEPGRGKNKRTRSQEQPVVRAWTINGTSDVIMSPYVSPKWEEVHSHRKHKISLQHYLEFLVVHQRQASHGKIEAPPEEPCFRRVVTTKEKSEDQGEESAYSPSQAPSGTVCQENKFLLLSYVIFSQDSLPLKTAENIKATPFS